MIITFQPQANPITLAITDWSVAKATMCMHTYILIVFRTNQEMRQHDLTKFLYQLLRSIKIKATSPSHQRRDKKLVPP